LLPFVPTTNGNKVTFFSEASIFFGRMADDMAGWQAGNAIPPQSENLVVGAVGARIPKLSQEMARRETNPRSFLFASIE